jgi:hypothetical protein
LNPMLPFAALWHMFCCPSHKGKTPSQLHISILLNWYRYLKLVMFCHCMISLTKFCLAASCYPG